MSEQIMLSINRTLTALCSNAVEDLVLVAPFIKFLVLKELLQHTKRTVTVQVVTRWLPQDVRAGVTDVEVWDAIKDWPNGSLWIRDDLHAKYYRADSSCLVGSANLTGAALGLTDRPNLELLVSTQTVRPELERFEEVLLEQAVKVNDELADLTRHAASLLPPPNEITTASPKLSEGSFPPPPDRRRPPRSWVPSLRQPEDLGVAYLGRWDELTTTARRCAAADLEVLNVPPGLSTRAFTVVVGATLLRFPAVAAVARFVSEPRRFGEVRQFMAQELGIEGASQDWQVLLRWLLYFLGDRFEYRRPNYTEVIARRP
jgi:hypothetical protein